MVEENGRVKKERSGENISPKKGNEGVQGVGPEKGGRRDGRVTGRTGEERRAGKEGLRSRSQNRKEERR